MSEQDLESCVRAEKSRTYSVDEQIAIAHAMEEQGVGPNHEGIKRSELEDQLGLDLTYDAETSLHHLEEIDIVESVVPPGPDGYAISKRLDEIINGEVDRVVAEEIESLIDHIHDDDPVDGGDGVAVADGSGATVRGVVAEAFDLVPSAVEQHLRDGDQVAKLNIAVDAIENEEAVSRGEEYDRIIFRNAAYKWRLTQKAVGLYEA